MKLCPDKHEILSKILTLGPDNEMLKTALTLQAPKYNLVPEENVKVIQFQDGRTVLGGLARDVQYILLIMTSQYHIFILNIDMGDICKRSQERSEPRLQHCKFDIWLIFISNLVLRGYNISRILNDRDMVDKTIMLLFIFNTYILCEHCHIETVDFQY